jgi:surface antigen
LVVVAGSAQAETGGYPHADAAAHNVAAYEWWVDENGDGIKQITASDTDNDETVSGRGYFYRNCTDYVAWKLESLGVPASLTRGRGNGAQWDDFNTGVMINSTPAYGAAAVNTTFAAPYGHVSFVESVNSGGTITISEYNKGTSGNYGTRTGTPAALGIASFVHFGVQSPTAPPGTGAGLAGSVGDYNKDGTTDIAVFRPSTGNWHIRSIADIPYGEPGDIPVPGDYDGNGSIEAAVFRPSTGYWHIRGQASVPYGESGDVPVISVLNRRLLTQLGLLSSF